MRVAFVITLAGVGIALVGLYLASISALLIGQRNCLCPMILSQSTYWSTYQNLRFEFWAGLVTLFIGMATAILSAQSLIMKQGRNGLGLSTLETNPSVG